MLWKTVVQKGRNIARHNLWTAALPVALAFVFVLSSWPTSANSLATTSAPVASSVPRSPTPVLTQDQQAAQSIVLNDQFARQPNGTFYGDHLLIHEENVMVNKALVYLNTSGAPALVGSAGAFYYFDATSSTVQQVHAGAVLLGGATPGGSGGDIFRLVVSTSESNGLLVAYTLPGNITDIIVNGQLYAAYPVTMAQAQAMYGPLSPLPDASLTVTLFDQTFSQGFSFSPHNSICSANLYVGAQDEVKVTFTISIDVSLNWNFPFIHIQSIATYFTFTNTLTLSAQISAKCEWSKQWTYNLPSLNFGFGIPGLSIDLGVLSFGASLNFVFQPQFVLGIDVEVSGSVGSSVSFVSSAKLGAEYQAGQGLQMIHDVSPLTTTYSPPKLDADFTVKLFAKIPNINFDIDLGFCADTIFGNWCPSFFSFTLFQAYFYIEPYLEFQAQLEATLSKITYCLSLTAGLEIDAGVDKILIWDPGWNWQLFSKEWLLWQWPNGCSSGGATGPLTVSSFTANPSTVTVGNPTTLSVMVKGGKTPYTYSYSGLPPGCSSSDLSTLTCAPSSGGTYSVVVTVKDQSGSSARATVSLVVQRSSGGGGTGPGGTGGGSGPGGLAPPPPISYMPVVCQACTWIGNSSAFSATYSSLAPDMNSVTEFGYQVSSSAKDWFGPAPWFANSQDDIATWAHTNSKPLYMAITAGGSCSQLSLTTFLGNSGLWANFITEAINVAKAKGYNGYILDLAPNSCFTGASGSLGTHYASFIQQFASALKSSGLHSLIVFLPPPGSPSAGSAASDLWYYNALGTLTGVTWYLEDFTCSLSGYETALSQATHYLGTSDVGVLQSSMACSGSPNALLDMEAEANWSAYNSFSKQGWFALDDGNASVPGATFWNFVYDLENGVCATAACGTSTGGGGTGTGGGNSTGGGGNYGAGCPNSNFYDQSTKLNLQETVDCAAAAGFSNNLVITFVSMAYQESGFCGGAIESGSGSCSQVNPGSGARAEGILQEGTSGQNPPSGGAFPIGNYNPSSCSTYSGNWGGIYFNPTCAFQWAYAYYQVNTYNFWGSYLSGAYCKWAPTGWSGTGPVACPGGGQNAANLPWSSVCPNLNCLTQSSSGGSSYNTAAVVSYANNYYDKVLSDGKFFADSDCGYGNGQVLSYSPGTPLLSINTPGGTGCLYYHGLECAHFVSNALDAGGLSVPNTYGGGVSGDPSAPDLVNWLLGQGAYNGHAHDGTQVTSASQLSPGDVVGYYEGGTVIGHVAVVVSTTGGNVLVDAHTTSQQGAPWSMGSGMGPWVLIHITSTSAKSITHSPSQSEGPLGAGVVALHFAPTHLLVLPPLGWMARVAVNSPRSA